MGFKTGWTLFRLVVWMTIAVWIHPRMLDLIGGHGIAVWLERHGWIRGLAVPPLALLGIVSAFEVIDSPARRAKLGALAGSVGATFVDPPGLDPTYGIRQGPGLRVPLGRWSMDVATWKKKSRITTVARIRVEDASEFSFAARDARGEPAVLRGLQQSTMRFAMRDVARRQADSRAAIVVHALAYLAEAPIEIGHQRLDRTLVLRSNQPDLARALFTTGAVVSAVQALNAGTPLWSWTYYPAEPAGAAEMLFEWRGGLEDAESLRVVHALLRAALEYLAGRGAISD